MKHWLKILSPNKETRKRSSKQKKPDLSVINKEGAHEIAQMPQYNTALGCFIPSTEASIDAAKQVQTASRMKVTEKLSVSKIRQTALNILWRKGSGKEQ